MTMKLILLFFIVSINRWSSFADQRLIHLMEKLPVQTEVINLRDLFLPNQTIDADFFLAKKDDYPYFYFFINHSSRAILTIRKEIDRDQLCRLRRCRCELHCDLELEIFVQTNEFNVELLILRLIDQNDHRPRFVNFHQEKMSLTIVENAPIGAAVKLEPAIDDDQGEHGLMGYSLISSDPLPFSLRYDLMRSDLSLIVDRTLDRETISSYQFDILAYDGDNQTGLLRVYVQIDDVNDCPPKFHQSIYRLTNISEHTPIDSILARVQAEDHDSGVNAQITYHLLTDDPCFLLDDITGDLRLQCFLDYEVKHHYQLTIEAKDHGEGSKSDLCTLIIDLIDENDHAPIIDYYPTDLPMENDTLIVSLSEAIPIHSLILSFSILDRDAGDNARLTWKLHRSSVLPFDLIRLTENTGELRTKHLLDRETQSEYQLILEAYDHGRPRPKSTRLPIRIVLIDENDHPPRFASASLHATISEHVIFNETRGYEVYRVHAEDLDEGVNAKIRYSIVEENLADRFRIDEHTGIIRAMKAFDREEQSTYSFHVRAKDQGHPSLSSQTQLTFTIIPRNEYAPRCPTNVSWTVMENSPEGTRVGMILCTDDDQDDPNRQMSVHLRWNTEENRTNQPIPFRILTRKFSQSENTIELLLTVNGSLDRETIAQYRLIMMVTDLGNPPLTTDLLVTIDLLDANDHCPELHLENSFMMINRDLFPQNYVLHLIATDADLGLNGQVTFQLSSTLPFVQLHPNGTLILTMKSKMIRDDSYFILHLQVRDHGHPTPCLVAQTLRFYLGSNRTDWLMVLHQYQKVDEHSSKIELPSLSPTDKHRLNKSSSHSKHLQAIYAFVKHQHYLTVIALLAVLLLSILFVVLLRCLHLRLHRRSSRMNKSSSKKIIRHDDDESPAHNYTNLKCLQPLLAVAVSSSSPSSSSDSTIQNRTLNSHYTYTAIGTHEDLKPVDTDERQMTFSSKVELIMTTV